LAEELGPGVYFGYFNVDRWGQKVFHNGPYHMFVSNEVAKQLQTHTGKPLKLDVWKVHQPVNPGGGIVQGISSISATKHQGLVLDAASKSARRRQGKGLPVRLTVRNTSTENITLRPRDFGFVLVTNSPFSNDAIGYRDPEGRAYWYYQTSVVSLRGKRPPLRAACRQVLLPWTPQNYAASGQDVAVGRKTPTHHHPGVYFPLHIKPGGKFETTVVVGRELLPGEYEVFFYQPSGNFSHAAGPMSKRIAFEVVE